ncbi:Lactation elevated protein 1 [Hordeum vulgare]|nr:Lactation elevated protein 1 [Hordeum vulgare]
MEDPMLSAVTVEVAHAPSPRADLVAGHVAPAAVAQAHVAPSRKRQGTVVMQGGNPAAPAATARAPGANASVRSQPAAHKAGKAAAVKRRKGKIAQHRYKDMKASKGKFFKLEHCWELLQKCDKWKLIDRESPPKRGSLVNMDEDEDDDGPRNLHKPDVDKKTKEKMKREQEVASLREKVDAMVQSNELMLLKSLEIKKELAEKKAKEKQEKWQMLKEEGLRKAAIEERKARASETKSMSLLLAKENKVMSMNRNDMDDLTKTWHDMARREILKRRMVASTGPCSSSGDVFSAPYGANVDDFGAGVGTSVPTDRCGFGGADELQYGLHGAE